MNTIAKTIVSVLLVLTAAIAAQAQSTYFDAITNLNPTAYWPMHETTPPVPGDVETNYGTLGAVGNGYYADWNVNSGYPGDQVIQHQIPGALVNDSDGAAMFNFNGTANSYLLVPHTSPGTTLRPPFTIECWVWSSDASFGDIISQDGTMLNVGNSNNAAGIRISWNRGQNIQTYGTAGGLTGGTTPLNQWNYVAVTYDGTNLYLYVNGTNAAHTVHTGYVVDYWDPLTIGNGMWNNNGPTRAATHIAIDEVAVYNTIVDATTLSNRYDLGLNGLAGEYFTAVSNSQPVLYYRMDAPAYTRPDTSTWPVMTNYGTAVGIDGTYQPGLAVGSYEGPSSSTGVPASGLAAANSAPMNGLSTFATVTPPDASVFSPPTGTSPFSFSLWFKSNPSDCRYQTLVSQGNGWQLAQQTVGTLQFYLANTYQNTTGVYNDGNWHNVVVTYAATTGKIYVDGVLDSTMTSSSLTNPAPAFYALGIGCDTRFTGPTYASGAGRQYAGNICEVAFWNGTALDSSQVQALYDAAGMLEIVQDLQPQMYEYQGFPLTLSVQAHSPPLFYQWWRNGIKLTDGGAVSGANSDTLTISNAEFSNSGSTFQVVITNDYGHSVTSTLATVTVTPWLQFSGSGDGWTENGHGGYTATEVLQLTDGGKSEATSSFFRYPVYIRGFLASFTYQDVGGAGADGAVFVVQNDPRGPAALGGAGGSLGYGGIANSTAVEFKIYQSSGYAFQANGVIGPYSDTSPVDLRAGNPIDVSLTYLGGVLSMSMTDRVTSANFAANANVDIPAIVGADTAYVGITGASGGTASTQIVTNLTFVSLVGLYVQPAAGNQLRITWPDAVGGYVLQQSSSVDPANWTDVTAPVTNPGGYNQVLLPMPDTNTFYRLRNGP